MEVKMHINKIKSINSLNFEFPTDSGLYAITGENGSGKSTLISSAATLFFNMPMKDYFGKPEGASISFSLGETTRKWECINGVWKKTSSTDRMQINGFYEGSIAFGNRFKDNNFSTIKKLEVVSKKDLYKADEFVITNLGLILHNDQRYYDNLFVLSKGAAEAHKLLGVHHFYLTDTNEYISQIRMSTGENLLISILYSLKTIYTKRKTHNDFKPCIIFLDEIELALHSSALRRLILFLKQISEELNMAIFFSTHSLELIREIKPQNIYYLQRNFDHTISVTNPCYPAFATRNLYGDDGYGNDVVILVEDDFAKMIVDKILYENDLLKNIRLKVLPTGGWTNTITMAYDITSSHLLNKGTKLIVVLDRDIKDEVPNFIKNHKEYSGISIDYLPIKSLEKYLKHNLFIQVDNNLYNYYDTYLFQKRPIIAVINDYNNENEKDDLDGKILMGYITNELKSMRKGREDLADITVKYLMKSQKENIERLVEYLKEKIAD